MGNLSLKLLIPTREEKVVEFMDALGDYIDARIQYDRANPEWRSSDDIIKTGNALQTRLEKLLP